MLKPLLMLLLLGGRSGSALAQQELRKSMSRKPQLHSQYLTSNTAQAPGNEKPVGGYVVQENPNDTGVALPFGAYEAGKLAHYRRHRYLEAWLGPALNLGGTRKPHRSWSDGAYAE